MSWMPYLGRSLETNDMIGTSSNPAVLREKARTPVMAMYSDRDAHV